MPEITLADLKIAFADATLRAQALLKENNSLRSQLAAVEAKLAEATKLPD